MRIFKQKQPRINDAELVTSLTLSRMKKHLDQTQSHVSAFPRIGEMTRGYGVGTMGKGVALHLEIEAERQHRFVHEIDGLHYAG